MFVNVGRFSRPPGCAFESRESVLSYRIVGLHSLYQTTVSVMYTPAVCEIGKYFWGVTDCHARRRPCTGMQRSGFWTHFGPTQPLPGVQDDINLIVTCFDAVIIIVLKTYFRFLYTELRYWTYICPMV